MVYDRHGYVVSMVTDSNAITDVECPECSTDVATSLPRSAEIVSLGSPGQNGADGQDVTDVDRRREHEINCSNDHPVVILYDW